MLVEQKLNKIQNSDTQKLLEILLQDKTTKKNIIWATDNYSKHGILYAFDKPIKMELITAKNRNIIKPRTQKSKGEQQNRIRQKAEVFTPSWICNMQNNLIDNEWFGKENVFNIEEKQSWTTNHKKIVFPETVNKKWTDYVESTKLEITCGESPYLVSRYDSVSGNYIEVKNRIGLLDRKLRIVSENTNSKEDWLKWATIAVQNVYGYDWQGDNVFLARENLLFDIAEHYEYKFNQTLEPIELEEFAKIIVWNIWQMDGLKFVIPNSCCIQTKKEETLFGVEIISTECEGCKKNNAFSHNGVYCKIKDWKKNKIIRFVDMIKGGKNTC